MTEEKNWADLTPKQRQEERFKRWLSPQDIEFSSPEAELGYKERVTRLVKAIKLEEPDRVPVSIPAGFFPAYYNGGSLKTVMHDYDELRKSWLKFLNDFFKSLLEVLHLISEPRFNLLHPALFIC